MRGWFTAQAIGPRNSNVHLLLNHRKFLSMNTTQLSQNYWVSPQITVEDVQEAQNLGFTAIVCNRPDGEAPEQTPAAEIQEACAQVGIKFLDLPMWGPNYSADMVTQLQQLLAEESKVLGYCRSGNRSSILFQAVPDHS